MEIRVRRSAASSRRCPEIDHRNGYEQCDVGRETDRKRTLVEDRYSDFTAHRQALYAEEADAPGSPVTTLDDFCTQSCQSHHRCGLFRGCDGDIPAGLC